MMLIITVTFFIGYGCVSITDGKFFSKADLIKNYNEKKTELNEAKNYYNKIVPSNQKVDIEFNSDEMIERLSIITTTMVGGVEAEGYFTEYNIPVNSRKMDSILKSFNWNTATLAQIKSRLDKANCISILNGEPAVIGFQRSGLGMYFYNLYSQPIPDDLKARYAKDSCTHIIYNNKVILEYGGGAIGPQCFAKEPTPQPQK